MMRKIPDNILHFVMDSPLWEEGQTAYWTRVPNVKQTEAECGAKLGQSRGVDPNDNFHPWIGHSLAHLCRDWVYNKLNRMGK